MTWGALSTVLIPRTDSEWIGTPDRESFVTVKMRGSGAIRRSIGEGKTPRPFRGSRIRSGDLIYSRIDARNGAFAIVPPELDGAVVSKDFPTFGLDVDRLDPAYLAHLVRAPAFWARFQAMSYGATNRQRIDERLLLAEIVPLPPLPEQRRIAAILDEADALRRARITQRDIANDAVERAVQGVIEAAPRSQALSTLVCEPFRNGISPSRVGTIEAEVLTLSAITRGAFDPSARKQDTFTTPHSADKLVREGLHLICRGNGNADLVGAMAVAPAGLEDVAFPDTMIATRPSAAILSAALAAAWRSDAIREQIRRGARTTNGTFKINQQVLAAIEVPVPTPSQQAEIGELEQYRGGVLTSLDLSLAQLDALFASLQHRAFRGEL